uniref:Uncharacterized protein n=1 Tax=viral metagenome TaxID=1070528 RepID=A0A6C0LZ73_9ZZZZ
MDDLSKLSKGELIERLKATNKSTCAYRSTRSNTSCTSLSTTAHGYCDIHADTLQAASARERYEKASREERSPTPPNSPDRDIEDDDEDEPEISVQHNRYGNFEHAETHIVFNINNHKAIGVQMQNGDIAPLRPKDISECISRRWKYQVPSNAGARTKPFGKKW